MIFLGNSANNLHPIGGQGFNLGLRDVKVFSRLLREHENILLDSKFSLEIINKLYSEYQSLRKDDHSNLLNSTHGILKLFANDNPLVKLVRGLGMTAVNHSLILRTIIADHSMGLRV